MNRPLIAAAVGAVVVGLAIGLNFLPSEEDAAGSPTTESAEEVRAAARAAAAAATAAAARTNDQSARKGAASSIGAKTESAPAATAKSESVPTATAKSESTAAEKAAATSVQPSFDVVRINPKGDTVMAGRAAPGSIVEIMDGEAVIGTVTADHRGDWVFVPETPLAPGDRQLSLRATDSGETPITSESVVVLVVPERGKDVAGGLAKESQQALALKEPRTGGASTVLQKPLPDPLQVSLKVDTVDYDDSGAMAISGIAPPGVDIQLYLDNRFIGRTRTNMDGAWSLTPETRVKPGLYTLRIDQVDAGGKVQKRIAIPFARAEPLKDVRPGRIIVVQPGNSLWRLARTAYGDGFAFTVIYGANKEQIKDPDMIFPGQVFTLPATN